MRVLATKLLPTVAALGLLATAPAARAAEPTIFEYFSSICLKHVFDVAGARGEAVSQGFTQYQGEAPNREPPEAYVRETAAGRLVLGLKVSGQDSMGVIPKSDAVTCGFSSSIQDAEAAGQAARWVGLPEDPEYSTANDAVYFFTEIDGVRGPIKGEVDPVIADGLRRGRVWMVMVRRNPKAPSIMIQVSQASARPQ